jgi:hypothetical protein
MYPYGTAAGDNILAICSQTYTAVNVPLALSSNGGQSNFFYVSNITCALIYCILPDVIYIKCTYTHIPLRADGISLTDSDGLRSSHAVIPDAGHIRAISAVVSLASAASLSTVFGSSRNPSNDQYEISHDL